MRYTRTTHDNPHNRERVTPALHNMPTLSDGWKKKRKDLNTERYWNNLASKRKLNGWEEEQREWNFIEIKYSHRPSNNGLAMGNPAFAFTTNLAKYIKMERLHDRQESEPCRVLPT